VNAGRGRTFYTTLGHRDDLWTNDPVFRAHVTGGIRWALGLEN
jgi:type 1 glutamine amidotransferase